MATWLRDMRTFQEHREWYRALSIQSEYPQLKLRKRRSDKNLIDSWEDVCRGDMDDRSWKRHRSHQYKPIDGNDSQRRPE